MTHELEASAETNPAASSRGYTWEELWGRQNALPQPNDPFNATLLAGFAMRDCHFPVKIREMSAAVAFRMYQEAGLFSGSEFYGPYHEARFRQFGRAAWLQVTGRNRPMSAVLLGLGREALLLNPQERSSARARQALESHPAPSLIPAVDDGDPRRILQYGADLRGGLPVEMYSDELAATDILDLIPGCVVKAMERHGMPGIGRPGVHITADELLADAGFFEQRIEGVDSAVLQALAVDYYRLVTALVPRFAGLQALPKPPAA